jgi:Uma2 family endonuclease
MASQTTMRAMTPAELEAMDPDGERYELIRGELREVPGEGLRHGGVTSGLSARLGIHVRDRVLGDVFLPNTRFVFATKPPSVMAPDVAFVRADRLPPGELPAGFGQMAPDLAAEVVSPSQYEPEVLGRVAIFLESGVRLVWVLRLVQRTVTVFRPDAPERILTINDELDGADVVPGFRLPLTAIFRA